MRRRAPTASTVLAAGDSVTRNPFSLKRPTDYPFAAFVWCEGKNPAIAELVPRLWEVRAAYELCPALPWESPPAETSTQREHARWTLVGISGGTARRARRCWRTRIGWYRRCPGCRNTIRRRRASTRRRLMIDQAALAASSPNASAVPRARAASGCGSSTFPSNTTRPTSRTRALATTIPATSTGGAWQTAGRTTRPNRPPVRHARQPRRLRSAPSLPLRSRLPGRRPPPDGSMDPAARASAPRFHCRRWFGGPFSRSNRVLAGSQSRPIVPT